MPGVTNPIGTYTNLSGIVYPEASALTTINADGTITINTYGQPQSGGSVEDGLLGKPTDIASIQVYTLPSGLQLSENHQPEGIANVDPTLVGSFVGFNIFEVNGTQYNSGGLGGRILALGNNGFVIQFGNIFVGPDFQGTPTLNFGYISNLDLVVSTLNLDFFDPITGEVYRPNPGFPGQGLPIPPFTIGGPITCYASGTRIETPDGPVAVERLVAGDRVLTASGVARAVAWAGRRAIDCARQPDPAASWPVRVAAGAFGPGLPVRDLYLSRDHAVATDGVLIPVGHLLNGRTVAAAPRENVTYHHIELETHDVLLAEGLPCESYLDIGARRLGFEGGSLMAVSLDLTVRTHDAEGCAPLMIAGPLVDALRARLAAIADEKDAATPHHNMLAA